MRGKTVIKTIPIRICFPFEENGCGTIFVDDVIECPNCKRPFDACEEADMVVMVKE